MATISSTIKLNDQMTPVFKSILKSMNLMVGTMGDVDKSAVNADFSRHFGLTKHAIEEATQALDKFEKGLHKVQNPVEQGAGGFSKWQAGLMAVHSAVSMVQSGIRTVVGLIQQGAGAVEAWVSEMSGAYNQQLNAQVQFAVVASNQGYEKSDFYSVMDKAAELQGRTLYGDELYIAGAAELATYLDDPRALESAMDTLAIYATGMSGGAELTMQQMVNYATQLGKGFDGTLDGLKKKGFDLTEEQKEIIETGTAMERVAAIADIIGESWGGLEEAMANTPSGALAVLRNDLGDVHEEVGEVLAPALTMLFQAMTEHLPLVRDLMLELGEAAKVGIGFLAQVILPLVVSGLEWLRSHVEQVKTGLVLLAGVVGILAGLFVLLLAIIAAPFLVAAMLTCILIQRLQELGGKSENVVRFVAAAFGRMYAATYNVFASLYNVVAAFAELLANVFDDPMGTIVRQFAGMADVVLGILQKLAQAIDLIFDSGLADTVAAWRDGLSSKVLAVYGEADIQIPRMQTKGLEASAKQFVEGADSLMNTLDSLEPFSLEDMISDLGWGEGMGGIDEIGHVGSVGRIDDDVTIAEEDIRLLKDLASREYQLSYTQLTPQQNNYFGDIRETADVNAVIGRLVEIGNEELRSSLVYGG